VETVIQKDRKTLIREKCAANGKIIVTEAVEILSNEEHWEKILEKDDSNFITAEKIKELLIKHESKVSMSAQEVVVIKSGIKRLAEEHSANFKILGDREATHQSSSEGKVKDFLAYFKDKYDFLSSLLKNRAGFFPKPIDKIKGLQRNEEVDIIGMVVKKWVSKNGNLTIELDSPEGRCIAIVSKDDDLQNREAKKILLDDVIGIKGKKFSDEILIVKSFVWPDIKHKPIKMADIDLSIGVISDVHVGSKLFMQKEFSKFVSWISGDIVSEKEAERAGKIKYLVIAGDNVDGVGIYPDQYDELEIKDIYEQYKRFAEIIQSIPEHIEIFICPGQHDATRRADPQPPIYKEYAQDLSKLGNVHLIGSPSWIEIEGLKCVVYHGGSFHDMYASMGNLNNAEPEKAMVEILRRRDFSTGFGLNQPYVPTQKDLMVIREEPDFYFGGDMHHKGYTNYRGCTCVNAGCWQGRTDFQIKEGHIPTPGIAIDINLKTRKITENNFLGDANV